MARTTCWRVEKMKIYEPGVAEPSIVEEAICSQVRNQHIMHYGKMRRQSPIDP